MSNLWQDLRYAVRVLGKSPGFPLAVVVTLALGIGVNTAVFSLVNGFLLRPLPYPEPERLGVLLLHSDGAAPGTGRNFSNEDDSHTGDTFLWVKENVPWARAASYGGLVSGVNLSTGTALGAETRYVHNMRVSAHFFDVLGTRPLLGREFSEDEDRKGGAQLAVLSYGLWRSAFQSDRQVIGKVIQLKGAPFTVIGVLSPEAETIQQGRCVDATTTGA